MLHRKKLLSIIAVATIFTVNNVIVPSPVLATEVTNVSNTKTIVKTKYEMPKELPIITKFKKDKLELDRLEKLRLEEVARQEALKIEEKQKQEAELARIDAEKAKLEAERLAKIKAELEAKGTDEKKKAEILKGTEALDKLRGTTEYKEFTLTFYTSLAIENGNSLEVNCHGKRLADGMVASNCLPQGTKLFLDGMGNYEVADTGAQQYFSTEDRLDIFVPRIEGETDEEYSKRTMSYGVKKVYGYIINDANLKVISDKLPPSAPVSESAPSDTIMTQQGTSTVNTTSSAQVINAGSTTTTDVTENNSGTNKSSTTAQVADTEKVKDTKIVSATVKEVTGAK